MKNKTQREERLIFIFSFFIIIFYSGVYLYNTLIGGNVE